MSEYGGFEMVGALPWSLPAEDRQTTTLPGDIMLYQSNNMEVFYGCNSWNYTPIGKIDEAFTYMVKDFLGSGNIKLTISLDSNSEITDIYKNAKTDDDIYDLKGNKMNSRHLSPGIYIKDGRKFVMQ